MDSDSRYMNVALDLARRAAAAGEVPVGCIIVHQGEIIARSHNSPIALHDPCAHAEILALRQAGQVRSNYRLVDCDLYVTLEPCAMCAGALVHARVRRLVFGAADPRAGAAGTVLDVLGSPAANHRVEVTAGVEAEACGALLTEFFRQRRK